MLNDTFEAILPLFKKFWSKIPIEDEYWPKVIILTNIYVNRVAFSILYNFYLKFLNMKETKMDLKNKLKLNKIFKWWLKHI